MAKSGKDGRRRFRAPAWEARIPVGRVADQREVVGNRCRRDTKLRDDAGFVAYEARAAIQLHDARAAHALGKVLVRRADNHPLHAGITSRRHGRGRERIVRLEFDHRPDDDAGRRKRLFEQRKLRQQIRLDALTGFVAGPQSVSK